MTLISTKVTLASDLQSEPMADPEPCSESSASAPDGKRQQDAHSTANRVRRRVVTAARREQNKTAQRAYRMSHFWNS